MNRTFIILFLICLTGVAVAQTSACRADLAKANDLFESGNYRSAQQLATTCLQKEGVTSDERVEAFKILGKISAASGDVAAAKAALSALG